MCEKNYDFRKRHWEYHKPDRRNFERLAAENEVMLDETWAIGCNADADSVCGIAVRDFRDYLEKSMNLSLRLVRENGEKVKYTSNIDGKDAASVMLVVGSNISGLSHENWKTNMNFAVTLQEHTQMLYSNLCRPINFRSQRFNQQLAPGAIIVEVGTNGNTLDEALLGAKYTIALFGKRTNLNFQKKYVLKIFA